ncbi:PAS domain S-box protein [Flavobacterium lacus]|uniref:histidine kinase n=1 Tax=Flavobacterium lacus TaxID=1353778 RepID=A0A328WQ66_9FLAO|nr:PAS domain S-box protein [Flavobacterium lacus]RAR47256.1 PAS domain S-box-containing protein [Flavobacterium lacus]
MVELLESISKSNETLLRENNIDFSLQKCVNFLGIGTSADRCYIFKNKIANAEIIIDYEFEWCNDGIIPYIDNPELNGLSYDAFPGLYDILSSNQSIHGLVSKISNEYFRDLMTMQGIKSYLFMPLFSNDLFWGWIGFDNCNNERLFCESEVTALKSVANNIGLRLEQETFERNLTNIMNELNAFITNSNQAKWEWNLESNIFKFSHNWFGMLGYKETELSQDYETWKSLVHPEDLPAAEKKIKNFIEGKLNKYEGNLRMIHKKGHEVWIKYSSMKFLNKKNKVIKLIGTHIDISDYKLKEMELKISEDKFKFIAENTTDLICQHNTLGVFTYVSNSSIDLIGYDREDLIGKNPDRFIHPDDIEMFDKLFIDKKVNSSTLRFLKKNGDYCWLEVIAKPISQNGRTVAVQTSSRDVTSRITAERETANALQKEKELNQLKSNFVTMASHQFRTPLTVIYSNIELMSYKTGDVSKKLKSDIDTISTRIISEVDRMTELMNNILIFGKYESGNLTVDIQQINLELFVSNLLDVYHSNKVAIRKMKVEVVGQTRLIKSDENLLMEVLNNVISNAFKYSQNKRSPILKISYREECFEIKITDFGIGIPEEDQKHLYKSFFRARNTTTIKGSGLGLIIAKQFTELLNGTIHIDSKIDEGTTVTLKFPYEN